MVVLIQAAQVRAAVPGNAAVTRDAHLVHHTVETEALLIFAQAPTGSGRW